MKIVSINEDYRWLIEYRDYMIFCQLQVKKKWLCFNWFGNAFRGFYISTIPHYKGSQVGIKIGIHQVYCYDEYGFDLKTNLYFRFKNHLKYNISNHEKYIKMLNIIDSL